MNIIATATQTLHINDQLCKELLTTAVEGGCAYWMSAESVEREPKPYWVTKIVGPYDPEEAKDTEIKWDDVTLDTVALGIQRLLENPAILPKRNDIREQLRASLLDPDECQWDAETADIVVQIGMFNDLVYG